MRAALYLVTASLAFGQQKPLTRGPNPPVVLLNGYQLICSATPVNSSDTFGRLEQLLTESGREVRFFDNCLQRRISIERLGQALGAYLADMKYDDGSAVEEVDLIGHSMGGLIARCYLSGRQEDGTFQPPFPKRVRKLITIGTPHFGAEFGVAAPDLQAAAMIPGTRFLWELATWNQFQEDLRGVSALTIVGRSKDRPGDGLVSALSASSYFVPWLPADRTRLVAGCHTSGIGAILLGCNFGETAIANIGAATHPTWPLIRGFLAGDEESLRERASAELDTELSAQASLWIGYSDESNTVLDASMFAASFRDAPESEPELLQAVPNSPARILTRTRLRDTNLEIKPDSKESLTAPVALGRGVKTLAYKSGMAIRSVEPLSTEDGVFDGGARLLPSGGRLRIRGIGLEMANRVDLDGVVSEVIAQSADGGIVIAVAERGPGAAMLSVYSDAGAHSIRVVFGTNPARLVSMDGRASWNAVAGASGYALWLGSAVGKSDLAEVGLSRELSVNPPMLPSGRVFARLWTLWDGIWSYRDTVVEIP